MLTTLAQVELAGALAVAGAMRRHAELSLRQAESLADKLLVVAREPLPGRGGGWDLLFAEIAAEFRVYVRELAASPGLAAMSFLEHLDRLRTAHRQPDRSGSDVETDRPKG
ncbi:MAG: hypothetical protein ACLQJR_18490 [Stellaceae bacterium]